MTTVVANVIESYFSSFEAHRLRWAQEDPPWLFQVRSAAMERFGQVGFPKTRDEEWRQTNIAPIAQREFRLAGANGDLPTPLALAPLQTLDLGGPRLVFVDGCLAKELSRLEDVPAGVTVSNLAELLSSRPEVLQPHLARHADPAEDAFTALNTAFLQEGAYLYIDKGVVVEEPIELLYLSTSHADPFVTHPRNLIVAEPNSQVNVVERHVSLSEEIYWSNGVTEAVVGENASLFHYYLEEEGPEAFSVATLRTQMAPCARLETHTVLLGGSLVRSNVQPILGEGCDLLVNGLYVGGGRQHLDNHMRVEHAKPRGTSRQFYKGILDGKARGVFAGRIIVRPGAQKTDAKQTNMNLLLSEEAEADSKPQLEIDADDVKCTHGATIGRLSEEAIFYLRSRGIAEPVARDLLVQGFAAESLARMKIEPLRRYLEESLARRLSRPETRERNR